MVSKRWKITVVFSCKNYQSLSIISNNVVFLQVVLIRDGSRTAETSNSHFNPLMPGVPLFTYVWPFCYQQALKG